MNWYSARLPCLQTIHNQNNDELKIRTVLTMNWYSAWLPYSEAANRKPVLSTHMLLQGGMVSKYLILSSATRSPSYDSVTL